MSGNTETQAVAVVARFRRCTRFAVIKLLRKRVPVRYMRADRQKPVTAFAAVRDEFTAPELESLAQEHLCVLAGLMPGVASSHGKLAEWETRCETARELERWVQHSLDWRLSALVRQELARRFRAQCGSPASLDSLDRRSDTDDWDTPHADPAFACALKATSRPSALGNPSDVDTDDFWSRYPEFAAHYRDGYTLAEIGERLGVSKAQAGRIVRDQQEQARKEYEA